MEKRQPKMHCPWSCEAKFRLASEYRAHCALHIEATIAAIIAEQQINLPTETWAGVLPSCGRESLVERVSLTRRQFHAIARPLIDGPKRRTLPYLAFLKEKGVNTAILVKRVESGDGNHQLVELPIAEVPPPRNVVNFSRIKLNYFDEKVLSFLCVAIRPLIANKLCLKLHRGRRSYNKWDGATNTQHHRYEWQYGLDHLNLAALECLLRVFPRLELAITALCIRSGTNVISVELLARLLTNVRHLRLHCEPPASASVALTAAYSSNCSPHMLVLIEWLHTPSEDGQPKMARLNVGNIENLAVLLTQAQQHFLSANSNPVPYFVGIYSFAFDSGSVLLPFSTLRNEHTGEVLSLRHYNESIVPNGYDQNFVLYRRCSFSSTEQSEKAELLEMRQTFSRTLFPDEPRNSLVLNVAWMGQIDESLFASDLGVERGTE